MKDRYNKSLTRLDLEWNGIGVAGADAIAKALMPNSKGMFNTTLKALNLKCARRVLRERVRVEVAPSTCPRALAPPPSALRPVCERPRVSPRRLLLTLTT